MTDSSTEEGGKASQEGAESRKVPVEAVAKERAEKRAARAEVTKLNEELENVRKTATIDEDTLNSITMQLAEEAKKAVAAELKPMQDEVAKYKMAMTLGLSEPQADKVMELRMKNPGLSESQALVLAKAEHGDLFPANAPRSWSPAHGGLPVSGNPERMGSEPDYVAKMNEAASRGDRHSAQKFAQEEALRRFRAAFLSRPTR
jgi:hypothetical protein